MENLKRLMEKKRPLQTELYAVNELIIKPKTEKMQVCLALASFAHHECVLLQHMQPSERSEHVAILARRRRSLSIAHEYWGSAVAGMSCVTLRTGLTVKYFISHFWGEDIGDFVQSLYRFALFECVLKQPAQDPGLSHHAASHADQKDITSVTWLQSYPFRVRVEDMQELKRSCEKVKSDRAYIYEACFMNFES
eukprot:6492581-Amphidinium_carterae.4